MTFNRDQVSALRTLVDVWGADRFVLIGAGALAEQLPMAWRHTDDLDLAVAMGLEEYPAGLDALPGWTRDRHQEQRWLAPGVRVDVLPVSDGQLAEGSFIWPETGTRMNLTGLGLALQHCAEVDVARGISVRLARVPVLALLKMTAYLDRPAARERDLQDIAYILTDYEHDSDRRFSESILELEIPFERTTAHLLGRDLAEIAGREHCAMVHSFIESVQEEPVFYRMLRLGPHPDDPGWLRGLLTAFLTAMGSG